MLKVIQRACETFISTAPEFWLLAGTTDVSFETGGNARYRHAINQMREHGCLEILADQLLLGVNGNVARILERQHPKLRENKGRKGRLRPDIWFGAAGSPMETIVEVKAIYEMTM